MRRRINFIIFQKKVISKKCGIFKQNVTHSSIINLLFISFVNLSLSMWNSIDKIWKQNISQTKFNNQLGRTR